MELYMILLVAQLVLVKHAQISPLVIVYLIVNMDMLWILIRDVKNASVLLKFALLCSVPLLAYTEPLIALMVAQHVNVETARNLYVLILLFV
jgi:hypothetical protein